MSSTPAGGPTESMAEGDRAVVPALVEWLVAAFLTLGGLALATGGAAILWVSDEALIAEVIAEGVAEGTVRTEGLTEAQLTAIATDTSWWLGVGLLVVGVALVAVAIAYIVGRRRSRRADGAGSERELRFSNALLGAVTSWLLSFVPASPALGGAVAGYVHRRRGSGPTAVGAISGLLAALPVVTIIVFLTVGLALGFGSAGIGGLGVVVALALAIGVVGTLIYFVGLSALGAYLADRIADDG